MSIPDQQVGLLNGFATMKTITVLGFVRTTKCQLFNLVLVSTDLKLAL